MNRTLALRSMSRTEFDAFATHRSAVATIVMDEVEWYADDDDLVIGFVARHKLDADWSVCVLGPGPDGHFRAIDGATSIGTQSEARSRLFLKMESILASGGLAAPYND